MATLVLVRHGKSLWNKENRFTGWVDVPLTDEGREEARRAGRQLKGMRFDVAYTSVLSRAQETLAVILGELGQPQLPTIRDQALNERHYGDLQGLDKAETARRYGDEQVKLWRRSYDVAPPGGESLELTAKRTLPFYERCIGGDLRQGKAVLVAAHGNSLRSIVMALDGLTPDQVVALELGTGVPLVYELDAALKVKSKRVLG
jgi:2,3-bisphosphoglycerate-dependent phosphoglycerate mutase